MSDETRTPNANTVRSVFVRAHPFSASTSYEDRRAEFDRFIRGVRVEAWGEGATTALVHAGFVVPYDAPIFALNPYGSTE